MEQTLQAILEDKYCKSMLIRINQEDGIDEFAHRDMDEILCSLLEELGYTKLVKIYKTTEKWYE